MKTVSMVEFRKNSKKILNQAKNGERMILTYRKKPILRLEPITDNEVSKDDPFYALDRLADSQGKTLSNEEMDSIIYEK